MVKQAAWHDIGMASARHYAARLLTMSCLAVRHAEAVAQAQPYKQGVGMSCRAPGHDNAAVPQWPEGWQRGRR